MRRVVGDHTLTFEKLSTLMASIEACLNSRPLVPLTDDPSDLEALTAAHFLIGRSLLSLPESGHPNVNPIILQRWQLINQMRESLWVRWKREYLQSLQVRGNWNKEQRNLKVGDLVLVTSEQTIPSHWPLARVTQVFSGTDGFVRAVEVRTSTSILRRSVTKLVLLLPQETD